MDAQSLNKKLNEITQLSRDLGGPDYVIGGGGNSSVKVDEELWIKPSGSRLKDLTSEQLVGLNRAKLKELFDLEFSSISDERESQVKKAMFASILPQCKGRPSVESPLHECIPFQFVYHTHPPLINALTCAQEGEKYCLELFPEALWISYVDPGYTLSMGIKNQLDEIKQAGKPSPKIIILENHGIFVGADTIEEIKSIYKNVINKLKAFVSDRNQVMPSNEVDYLESLNQSEFENTLKKSLPNKSEGKELHFKYSTVFPVAEGPLTPDHVVYMKPFPFIKKESDSITESDLKFYFEKNGFWPQIFIMKSFIAGVSTTESKAQLVLEIARDSHRITHLTPLFGGTQWMSEAQWRFIEGWEVEKYRQSQA